MIISPMSTLFVWGGGGCVERGSNNDTHKHKQHNNNTQHKIKTNDHPKLPIAGWFIFDYWKKILFWFFFLRLN